MAPPPPRGPKLLLTDKLSPLNLGGCKIWWTKRVDDKMSLGVSIVTIYVDGDG